MSKEKKIDRLYVDRRDVKDFNRLKERDSPFAGCQNKDIFLAAMVVGYQEGSKIPLKNKEGYVREEYLTEEDLTLIKSIAIAEEGDLKILLDKEKVFSIAEQYATGGITLLKAKVFSDEYGSYAKKLESELLRVHEAFPKVESKKPEAPEFESVSIPDLIEKGETDFVELKSSLIWDYKKKQPSKLIGMIVAKTISSFMNSNGGIILIGVSNDKRILGLTKDLAQLKGSLDNFELHLTNKINSCLGKIVRPYIKVKFEKVNNKDVAVIQVKKSPRPIYLKCEGKTSFFIRSGNSCQPLDISEANLYIKDHWPDLR